MSTSQAVVPCFPFLTVPMTVARSDGVWIQLNLNSWDVGCRWLVWFASEMVPQLQQQPAMEEQKQWTKILNTHPCKQSEQCAKRHPMTAG